MHIDGLQKTPLSLLAPEARTRLGCAQSARLDAAQSAAGRGDVKETARQLETLFAVMLVRELRRSMPAGPFGGGAGADIYEGWFDEHLGAALGAHDALGIAGLVKATLGRSPGAESTEGQQP